MKHEMLLRETSKKIVRFLGLPPRLNVEYELIEDLIEKYARTAQGRDEVIEELGKALSELTSNMPLGLYPVERVWGLFHKLKSPTGTEGGVR